ncbi:coiled-coil alpha-helical rod protein 1 [Hemiscyllium ocellatum]|uniref:coiled-coil alpha-helical rod protein 1 n=1 Tax=Hemiscyllium ocellatum TaxID=170820 RepID=UPI002965DF94|nr:coiled-coil alpha-helical rod protein 1 [Hemiscyllium ocellatum]
MSARSRRQLEPGLEPPAAFSRRHHEAEGLIPPSHFEVRCPGPPAVDTDPWAALSKATKDILELRQENERLRELQSAPNRDMPRGRAGGEMDKVCSRARSLDQERAHKWPREATEQAEIITEQIREIHRLTGEARLLRSTVEQQATVIREKESLVTQLTEQLGEMRAELREQRREASQLQLQCQAETDGVQSQHQLEIQRLETQLVQAQAASSEEAEQLRSELKELRERYRHEVSALEEELVKQAAAKSEDNQLQIARLQDAQYQRMAEILQLAESRDKNCAALKDRVSELEEELRQSREKGQREAAHFREKLEAVTQERGTLQEDLRKTKLELESQNSVITQLRTYIGQLVPDEKQIEESRQEKVQLNNKVQHLEKEREALKVTAELMNIRLRSLNDILTIQESESSRKPKQGVPEGENAKRLPLVTRWREKVFTLMVQLKSQEISHANDINQLHVKLTNLEGELRVKEQEQALLLHSFEDRTAEMNMERVQNQTLREELASAQSDTVRFQGNAERAENTLCHLKEVVSSFYQRFLVQETEQRKALCRLGNLGQRVTFANKRIDTIHGLLARKDAILRLQLQEKRGGAGSDTGRRSHEDLEKELEVLNRERDQLAAELKKTSQLIEKKVTEARLKCDSELKDHLVVRGQLEEALEERTQCQQRLTEELRECQKELADSQGAAESLQIELAQQQQKYEQALAGKVEEAERRLAEQLSEMERQLNEARRGHTKAVVALRQTERQAARDKERMQACEKLHEEQHQKEIQRLSTKLRELERDRNLLVATLRQEGLLSRFRKSRAVAIQSTAALSDKEELARPLADSQASKTSSQVQTKASLTEVFNELELLTAAVIGDQEGEDTNEEEETK